MEFGVVFIALFWIIGMLLYFYEPTEKQKKRAQESNKETIASLAKSWRKQARKQALKKKI